MPPDLQALLALLPEIEQLEDDPFSITSKHVRIIIAGIKSIQGNVLVPRDNFVLCPNCEGKKGFNIANEHPPHTARWEPCSDCKGTGKILASRLALMLSAAAAAPSPTVQENNNE